MHFDWTNPLDSLPIFVNFFYVIHNHFFKLISSILLSPLSPCLNSEGFKLLAGCALWPLGCQGWDRNRRAADSKLPISLQLGQFCFGLFYILGVWTFLFEILSWIPTLWFPSKGTDIYHVQSCADALPHVSPRTAQPEDGVTTQTLPWLANLGAGSWSAIPRRMLRSLIIKMSL